MGKTLKVMTFNLRIRARTDGENIFDNRAPRILKVIRDEHPDVIGFQEANDDMADLLRANLPEYYILGHGREVGYRGEGPLIAFRHDKLALHSFAEEMLSMTPDVPGSRIEAIGQSRCPRAFAYAELVERESGERFTVYNIHTDHIEQNVIYAECVMLMQTVGRRGGKVILTGDYNATPDTQAIRMIKANGEVLGLVDATEHIKHSFHNYGRKEDDFKIDYIFTNCKTDAKKSYAVENPPEGFYSDHYALCAEIEL